MKGFLAHTHAQTSHHTTEFIHALEEIKSDIQTKNLTTHQNAINDLGQDEKEVKLSPPDFEATLRPPTPPQTQPDTIKIHARKASSVNLFCNRPLEMLWTPMPNHPKITSFQSPDSSWNIQGRRNSLVCGKNNYSLQGIRFHLRKKTACPVPGRRN